MKSKFNYFSFHQIDQISKININLVIDSWFNLAQKYKKIIINNIWLDKCSKFQSKAGFDPAIQLWQEDFHNKIWNLMSSVDVTMTSRTTKPPKRIMRLKSIKIKLQAINYIKQDYCQESVSVQAGNCQWYIMVTDLNSDTVIW